MDVEIRFKTSRLVCNFCCIINTGMTALLQLTVEGHDFIIDPFRMHKNIQTKLKKILEDPNRLKVLCGAQNDALWLQRDFEVYIVGGIDIQILYNVFRDDGKKELTAFKSFVNWYCPEVEVNKTLQMADWRRRLLTEQMINYARQDTSLLLKIFNDLHNEVKYNFL